MQQDFSAYLQGELPDHRLYTELTFPTSFNLCRVAPPGLILEGVTRRLYNWSYRNVIDFLKENDFTFFEELEGSHEAWMKTGDDKTPDRIVEVNFTHKSYPPKTLKRMIRQSGIPQGEWIEWASS